MVNVHITGTITDGTVGQVLEAVLSDTQTIDIFINTRGGDAETSLAIYDLIAKDCRVATHIVGKAYSGGATIFFGGTRARTATPNSRLMIHKGWSEVTGNSLDLQSRTETLENVDAVQELIYSKTLPKKILKRFRAGEDVFLSSKELEDMGVLK